MPTILDLEEHGHQIVINTDDGFHCDRCEKNFAHDFKLTHLNCTQSTELYRRWIKRLNASQIQKSYIYALRHVFEHELARLKPHEQDILEDKKICMNITREQTEQGLKFLKRQTKYLNSIQLSIIETFTHFTFDGFEQQNDGWRTDYKPIYTVHGTFGSFSYISTPWQSHGAPFEVIKTWTR